MIVHAWVLFIWLLGKHLLIANVFDVGYSACRSKQCDYWGVFLLNHVVWELFVSTFLLLSVPVFGWAYFLIVELLYHVLCCLLERHANYPHMLKVHVTCEALLILLYGIMALLV